MKACLRCLKCRWKELWPRLQALASRFIARVWVLLKAWADWFCLLRRRWQILIAAAAALMLLASYPALVLGYVWIKVSQSELPGGHNGPLDAYRHTLASALVAYTLDEKVVGWVSAVMEHKDILTHRMDRHNNLIGAKIGEQAKHLWEIEPAVAKQVSEGRMMTRDPDQSTWLPESVWSDQKMW